MKISVVMVIHDNPAHLEKSLSSVMQFADEFIIGDYKMTAKIPQDVLNKAKIVKIKQDLPFADLVKEDLKKHATGDYILYLDPDEVVPDSLCNELKRLIGQCDCVSIPRKNMIFGKWIEHSRWWPDYQLRFFKRDAIVWPKTIHPVIEPAGNHYKLPDEEQFALLHYNYDSITHYLEKAIRYSSFEAEELIKNSELLNLRTTSNKAIGEFISRYFAADGYKDGMHGFALAFMQMFYYFLVYFYYWEKKGYCHEKSSTILSDVSDFLQKMLKESNHWMREKNLQNRLGKYKARIQNLLLR